MNEFDLQAKQFLEKTNTTLEINFLRKDFYFPDDKETRDIYRFKLSNNKGDYFGRFGASIMNTKSNTSPTDYDILACMDIIYSNNLEDFCNEFGLDNETGRKYYFRCLQQSEGLKRIFTVQELEMLSEIN